MNAERLAETTMSRIAASIGAPARTRMLSCLLDGRARTSTELAIVAEVSPSTASVHLSVLKDLQLVKVLARGKLRYYSLEGDSVAAALEALMVVAGRPRDTFVPNTPPQLRMARTCYDHMAGSVAVSLHDRLRHLNWLLVSEAHENVYELSEAGVMALSALGIDIDALRSSRRRFACACLDWSERRPHIAGALGAALLKVALARRWVVQGTDSRALSVTRVGARELRARFGIPD